MNAMDDMPESLWEKFPFKIFGYFEELMELPPSYKLVGTRDVDEPGLRLMGHAGRVEHTFTAPFTVKRGHKEVTIQASPEKPVVLWGTLQIKCGRVKE